MPVSPIYARLVESENDFLGILAYSVYKRQKAAFVAQTLQQYGAEEEVPAEVYATFNGLNLSEPQLAHYRLEAEALLETFADLALGEQSQQNRAEIQAEYEERLRRLKPAFFFGMWQSVAGSVVFTLGIGLLIFIIWSARLGFTNAVENVFEVKIIPRAHPSQSTPGSGEAAKLKSE